MKKPARKPGSTQSRRKSPTPFQIMRELSSLERLYNETGLSPSAYSRWKAKLVKQLEEAI